VANLLLVRATGRRREIAVCAALGALRSDIIRQLLAESLLLAFAGGTLGLLLAWGATPFFLHLAGNSLPRSNGVSVDGYVLGLSFWLRCSPGFCLAWRRRGRHGGQICVKRWAKTTVACGRRIWPPGAGPGT
jgi:predicted lysophospholipase L1 biosynthesis ABC-type transport system permease subunit